MPSLEKTGSATSSAKRLAMVVFPEPGRPFTTINTGLGITIRSLSSQTLEYQGRNLPIHPAMAKASFHICNGCAIQNGG
jgi:hypothetical protein